MTELPLLAELVTRPKSSPAAWNLAAPETPEIASVPKADPDVGLGGSANNTIGGIVKLPSDVFALQANTETAALGPGVAEKLDPVICT